MKDGDASQTVRDDILAAMEKHDEQTQVAPEAIEPSEPVEVVEPEQKEQPARGKDGKFAKKADAATEPGNDNPDDGKDVPEGQPEPEQPNDEQVPPVEDKRPPQALSAAIKGKWADIPDDVKNEFIRLETASAKGVASLKQDAHIGRELMEEIRPYEALINSAGGTPKTAVRNLLQTAALLRTGTPAQKQNAVIGIIREYGIQLNGLEPVQEDPYMAEITKLRMELQQQQQARSQQEESHTVSLVESFLNEADERGNQKYPLDDNLTEKFALEIAYVRQNNPKMPDREVLEKAYEAVSWAVPELRQTRLEQQQAALEAKRKEKAAQEVAKKQSAAVSVKGTGASVAPQSDLSVRQILEQQIYGTGNRV